MATDIPWDVLFAGAAALFSLFTVVVGRLNYADDELSRQNRIENRILDRQRRLEYDRPPTPRSGLGGMSVGNMLADDEPEFRFQVDEVLVTEKSGLKYLAGKILHGFDGEVSVAISATRWQNMTGGWGLESPPDFHLIEEFDFDERGMTCELRTEESTVVVTFDQADVEHVSDTIEDLLNHIESELGSELVDWESES